MTHFSQLQTISCDKDMPVLARWAKLLTMLQSLLSLLILALLAAHAVNLL